MIMASSPEKLEISLTLFLDKEKRKVLYAEAENDFVNILLSFLTLPLATISGLVGKKSTIQPCTLNSISSLRKSVENLDSRHFNSDACKGKLLNPINPNGAKFKNLVYNFDDPQMSKCFVGYLRKPFCFIVFDDLRVMPSDVNTTLRILRNLGIEYAPQKLTVHVTEKEVLDLLKFSLWSKTPLTDLFLNKKIHIQNFLAPLQSKLSEMSEVETEEDWKMNIMISKSQGKILFAEAEDELMDQIFSFLTVTLGEIEHLDEGNAGLGCIDNLYTSLVDFDTSKYFKSNIQHYAKRGSLLMVADDLSVTPFSSPSALALLRESKVCEEDLEVRKISIGTEEMLEIVKAAMFSSSALTIGLSPFLDVVEEPEAKKRKGGNYTQVSSYRNHHCKVPWNLQIINKSQRICCRLTSKMASTSGKHVLCFFHMGGHFVNARKADMRYVGGHVRARTIKEGTTYEELTTMISSTLGKESDRILMRFTVNSDTSVFVDLFNDGGVEDFIKFNAESGHVYVYM